MSTLLLGIVIGMAWTLASVALGAWAAVAMGLRIPEDWSPPESFPPMECGHDGYWRTHYGNCMACRAERAEKELMARAAQAAGGAR